MLEQESFYCDMCGLCCQNVGKIPSLKIFDRGDGICKNYNTMNHKCLIYNKRPILCNVDRFYDVYLEKTMTREEWHNLNYECCNKLKKV